MRKRKRFTEGWYYRLTLPENGVSFAFISSIEDPGLRPQSGIRLACIQVIGPDDEYVIQADRDDTLFWAWKKQQGFGCTFSYKKDYDKENSKFFTALDKDKWEEMVESGFQFLPDRAMGRVMGRNGRVGGVLEAPYDQACNFNFTIHPICGWGDVGRRQKSTGGWLSSFVAFEPHWQVTMADARATGSVLWNNVTFDFVDARLYAEKNWGAALPSKWYWTQCNSFHGYDQLSVTAGGGIRRIPFGRKEALGMVSVHYNGTFYEAVPWTGTMDWKVATWGYWELVGRCTFGDRPFEVKIIYECDPVETPGLVFRAPTPDEGMVRFCRDTFVANTTLSLWELEWNDQLRSFQRKLGVPVIDQAKSTQGGAEIGGGPWWDDWNGESRLKQPIRFLLQAPVRIKRFLRGSRLHINT